MADIKVASALWASSLLPEGIIEKWLRSDGAFVEAGEPVATVRIEDALHELTASAEGWLNAEVQAGSVIDPGTVIGHIGRR
jgi:pyruvate/2-oxoglutarate dehydrogenase complex dihydrolipoamide acyltransferase (E2) component